MGVLADIFIANTETANSLEDTSSIPPSDIAQYGRMTELEMGFIKQLLLEQPLCYDSALGFETVRVLDDGERITTKFPDDMLPLLASMNNETATRVAEGLARSEEMQCEPDDVMPVLIDLKRLALAAKDKNLNLYLWNCV